MFKELWWRTGIWYPQHTTAKPWTSEELRVSSSIWYCRVAEDNLAALMWRWHQFWPWGSSQEWLRKVGSPEDPTTVGITHWLMASGFWSVQLPSPGSWSWLQMWYQHGPTLKCGKLCRSWVYSCRWWHLCNKTSAPSSVGSARALSQLMIQAHLRP